MSQRLVGITYHTGIRVAAGISPFVLITSVWANPPNTFRTRSDYREHPTSHSPPAKPGDNCNCHRYCFFRTASLFSSEVICPSSLRSVA